MHRRRIPMPAAEREARLLTLTAKYLQGGIVVQSAEAERADMVSAGNRALAIRSLRRTALER